MRVLEETDLCQHCRSRKRIRCEHNERFRVEAPRDGVESI